MTRKAVTAIGLLLIAAASSAVEWVGGPLREALTFRREAVLSGEWWRLLTGHLVHLSPQHLWLNVAALSVLGWLLWCRPLGVVRFAGVGLGTALGVGLLLLVASPSVGYYVGLSGWLHGLVVMVIIAYWPSDRMASSLLVLGLVGKLTWEAVYGPNPATEAAVGGSIITASHRYGAVSAVVSLGLAAGLSRLLGRFR